MKLDIINTDVHTLVDIYEIYEPTGFTKACADNLGSLTTDLKDGTLTWVEDLDCVVLKHGTNGYVLGKLFWWALERRQAEKSEKDNLSNGFMLYQALSDIMKIDRFDMADLKHDEKFQFAQTVLNTLNSKNEVQHNKK